MLPNRCRNAPAPSLGEPIPLPAPCFHSDDCEPHTAQVPSVTSSPVHSLPPCDDSDLCFSPTSPGTPATRREVDSEDDLLMPPLISPFECLLQSDDEPFDLRQALMHDGIKDQFDSDTDEEQGSSPPAARLSSDRSPGHLRQRRRLARAAPSATRDPPTVLNTAAALLERSSFFSKPALMRMAPRFPHTLQPALRAENPRSLRPFLADTPRNLPPGFLGTCPMLILPM